MCESAFMYDLNGDGTISGSITRDQLNRPRAVQSCIGALEYTGNDTGVEDIQPDATVSTGGVYSVTGQYMGTDITALPHGIYIVNGHKIIQ